MDGKSVQFGPLGRQLIKSSWAGFFGWFSCRYRSDQQKFRRNLERGQPHGPGSDALLVLANSTYTQQARTAGAASSGGRANSRTIRLTLTTSAVSTP